MNNIYEQMRRDLTAARIAREPWSVKKLSFVIGNLMGLAKMVNGEKVVPNEAAISWIRKYINSLEDVAEFLDDETVEDNRKEAEFLAAYLPAELTADEIRKILSDIPFNSIKELMQYMKDNYAGRFNGKLASDIWKEEV